MDDLSERPTMNDDTERWLPVVGYEGYYEVSDLGRVRGVDRCIWRNERSTFIRGQILTQFLNEKRRPWVTLYRNDKPKTMKVHRVVAAAFLGPRPDGLVTCHADDDPTNNRLSNLRYDTLSANQYDAVRNGRHYRAAKTHCKRGHLLQAPNLKRHPTRSCLACHRSYSKMRQLKARGVEVDQQPLSDDYYRRIMKE
jgi:hypothetical protein